MKCAVVTLCIGEDSQFLAELTHPLLKAYADKIGAEFVVIGNSVASTPHWAKFGIGELLNKFDRIIYLDTDLIIRQDCPNLFQLVPYGQLGMFNEAKFVPREYSLIETAQAYEIEYTKLRWNGKYYNTGVIVASKCHRDIFKKPDLEFSSYFEQGYLNLRIALEECGRTSEDKSVVFDLSYKFNRMTCLDFSGEERHASYIIHYAGYKYFTSTPIIKELIQKDIEKWKIDAPDFKYKRHIVVIVSGGMGDQVDAEPTLRYIQKVYQDADVQVLTHWPRLFKHIPYPVLRHQDFRAQQDYPYFQMLTFPDPTTVTYSVVSNLMCHTVDYCSLATMHRVLPLREKIVELSIEKNDDDELNATLGDFDLNKAVLVHPGRHWVSKTFPREWWQDLVNKISLQVPVCLIGTDHQENRGAFQLDLPSNSFSLIDRTSVGSLISAISRAPVLISNDSAPVHIAGAFNNWIILIPTCKHPDHVLPFRMNEKGEVSNYHKAFALYKKLTLDDCDQRPTTWIEGGATAESKEGPWETYLPPTDEIIECAIKCYRESVKRENLCLQMH
jgi:hypothetical protein